MGKSYSVAVAPLIRAASQDNAILTDTIKSVPGSGAEIVKILSKPTIVFALMLSCAIATAQNLPAPSAPPTYNPMRAVHDVEVGKFYMRRGDIDGAIARFKDAMQYKPNYAEPCLQLGEAYEKKDDPANAIDYYQRYLKILPGTTESKKVRERIVKLQEQLKKDKAATQQVFCNPGVIIPGEARLLRIARNHSRESR